MVGLVSNPKLSLHRTLLGSGFGCCCFFFVSVFVFNWEDEAPRLPLRLGVLLEDCVALELEGARVVVRWVGRRR